MAKQPPRFGEFKNRAQQLVQSPTRLQRVVSQAAKKLNSASGDRVAQAKDQLVLFIALLKAWLSGDYRELSNKTIVIIVAAVLYFVVPLDEIPDFIFGLGFLDDVAVIGYVFGQLTEEMYAFEQWQLENDRTPGERTQGEDKSADSTDL